VGDSHAVRRVFRRIAPQVALSAIVGFTRSEITRQ
jgi:hypothetical protein